MAKRKSKHEEPENHERWVISYADFITLLFAFFVVMYATSNKNKDKEKKFEDSLRQELKMEGPSGGGGLGEIVENILNPNVSPMQVFNTKGVGPRELQDHVERLLEKSLTAKEKKSLISGIRHDAIGVRVSLAATALFPSGSAKLLSSAVEALNKVAETFREAPQQIIIEGHTDNEPISDGTFESNWELAGARASQVVRYLIKVHGYDPKRLAAISYADQKPLTSNDTEEGRSENRRIEFLIVTPQE